MISPSASAVPSVGGSLPDRHSPLRPCICRRRKDPNHPNGPYMGSWARAGDPAGPPLGAMEDRQPRDRKRLPIPSLSCGRFAIHSKCPLCMPLTTWQRPLAMRLPEIMARRRLAGGSNNKRNTRPLTPGLCSVFCSDHLTGSPSWATLDSQEIARAFFPVCVCAVGRHSTPFFMYSTHVEPGLCFLRQKVCLALQGINVVRDVQRSAFPHFTTKADPQDGKQWQNHKRYSISQNIYI